MSDDPWHRVWTWKEPEWFNAVYDATASAEGIDVWCEIQGPFCGYDACGKQTWDDFLANGPRPELKMPADIAADIRTWVLARRR